MDLPWLFDHFRYVMAALLMLTVPPGIVYWFIVHPFIGFWRRRGAKVTFWFLGFFMVGSAVALFPFRDALLGRDLGASPWRIALAVPILVAALLISRQRKKHLTFQILAGTPELTGEGPGLLREGIYGRIRHPRYVEFSFACVGWSLLCDYSGLYIMTALALVGLYAIVLIEERELRERFGQAYVDYSAQVPRFVPKFR